jgi:uncharacterized Fe-S radical SAM superfamily protein PflX
MNSPLKERVGNFNSDCTYLTDNSGAVDTQLLSLCQQLKELLVRHYIVTLYKQLQQCTESVISFLPIVRGMA